MDGFLPELFERWHALKANHVVTIVLFGRVSYDPAEIDLISPECLKHNEEVGWYKDFVRPDVHPRASPLGPLTPLSAPTVQGLLRHGDYPRRSRRYQPAQD
jgi:hypothetical protein